MHGGCTKLHQPCIYFSPSTHELPTMVRHNGPNSTESPQNTRTLHPALEIHKFPMSSYGLGKSSDFSPEHLRLWRASLNSQYRSSANHLTRTCRLLHTPTDICTGDGGRLHEYVREFLGFCHVLVQILTALRAKRFTSTIIHVLVEQTSPTHSPYSVSNTSSPNIRSPPPRSISPRRPRP